MLLLGPRRSSVRDHRLGPWLFPRMLRVPGAVALEITSREGLQLRWYANLPGRTYPRLDPRLHRPGGLRPVRAQHTTTQRADRARAHKRLPCIIYCGEVAGGIVWAGRRTRSGSGSACTACHGLSCALGVSEILMNHSLLGLERRVRDQVADTIEQ